MTFITCFFPWSFSSSLTFSLWASDCHYAFVITDHSFHWASHIYVLLRFFTHAVFYKKSGVLILH